MAQAASESFSENGVSIELTKLGSNSRSIHSKVAINASLDTVWKIMTDYEKFADVIPSLTVCKVVERVGNRARVYQIANQNLPLGMKFKSKVTLDCFEKDVETTASGIKRDLEYKMVEGDFQIFEGKWSIEQVTQGQKLETTLAYIVDVVKPKAWVPINLVEGKLCKEMQANLSSIRDAAEKMNH
ncbi:uncharacterized protein LOC126686122 isoform X2 [Mercurialis annua]|uniref:uncharacterized protein LOC126686122 isoform X2 n=1 Tax=Mercurialis annua TaxID=3986 RepID=UPI00215E5E05|nr:uncharacterized protein LOC126686122 isoform X2 [Mercurialis annua]